MPQSIYLEALEQALDLRPQIKVAVFDIDGTLLSATHVLSEETKRCVKQLKSRGIKTLLASGRPFFAAREIIGQLEITNPCVFFSGALVVDPVTSMPLHQSIVPQDICLKAISAFENRGAYLEIYTKDACFTQAQHPHAALHEQYLGQRIEVCDLRERAAAGGILKLVGVAQRGQEEAVLRELLAELSELAHGLGYGAAHPDILFANLTCSTASRQDAFKKLLEIYSVEAHQVAAFGDAEADIPFIELCGAGVAMENAPEAVKARAKYITCDVSRDGVPFALKQLGLVD